MLNTEEVKGYLGIDYIDEPTEKRLVHLIKVSDKILEGSIGKDYPKDDDRAKEIALIIIEDLFDNHSMNDKVTGNTRKLVESMSLQLILELRREKKDGI
ncbi:head-tail connector protein [Clostridium sp. CCUG 7971]|uniref:head-tail connector protein n=1 Tax=Clostridium sp. CCUG 7971 TaxID=2811414 RepID=UPI001ABACF37|nr:head-tail connector protein [Clostridium sp. CCUG 7971]MBO3443409.1 hypothetical protein [Clostridium sp. CCUG 7971]